MLGNLTRRSHDLGDESKLSKGFASGGDSNDEQGGSCAMVGKKLGDVVKAAEAVNMR